MRALLAALLCLLLMGAPCVEADSALEEQAAWLYAHRDQWLQESDIPAEAWFYTFTDLNHNGRMEAFAAITQGTGIFTTGLLYEIGEDFNSLDAVAMPEWNSLPEVIVERMPCYRQGDGYFYACQDVTRNGAAESWTTNQILSLEDGRLNVETLAWKQLTYDFETGQETERYFDLIGAITAEEFRTYLDRTMQGAEVENVRLDWLREEEIQSEADILSGYQMFAGLRRREAQTELHFYLEGTLQTETADLFTAPGCSLYIPREGWLYSNKDGVDCWQWKYNPEITLELAALEDADPREWVRTRCPGYDLIEDNRGGLGGQDAAGMHIADSRIETQMGNSWVLLLRYPLEAAEGAGVRMNVIADSFQLD